MAIRYPIVPTNITVHLGLPDESAKDITIPFTDYISNVAASELYPTWPRNALTANIYAIISFAMNRIYNEWYRSKGYNFDITSSPMYDQTYTINRSTYENIDDIVGEIFDNYIVKGNQIQPYFEKMYTFGTHKLGIIYLFFVFQILFLKPLFLIFHCYFQFLCQPLYR